MIEELMVLSTKRTNWFPAKHGILDTYSPMTIVDGRTLDYKKDCTYEFGTYVQAHTNDTTMNDEVERGIDAIYLRPKNNIHGGHRVMNQRTGTVITRNVVMPIPLPTIVKECVEEMANAKA